jgi:hypothetical protein
MIAIDPSLEPGHLAPKLERFWQLSGRKIRMIDQRYDRSRGSPVFTVGGRYTARGWTEWTEGFVHGSALLQFDATGDEAFLAIGRAGTVERMASHVSHVGVHDHGFNNLSTYGNLRRLQREGRIPGDAWEARFYELALAVSGAVQAARWTALPGGGGFIYSFNGPHSLFVDTVRSCRSLVVADRLGHRLMGEGDRPISLLGRAMAHLSATARHSIYYGKGRDAYDVRGRTAHECIFNTNDGAFRCPNSQQGFSPFTTWTRGLAWAMLGFAEQLEFFATVPPAGLAPFGDAAAFTTLLRDAAAATCDFYLQNTPACGIPYWDTGAPNLHRLGDYLGRPAEPDNPWEPVDSSAAAIAAQGLLRLGRHLRVSGEPEAGRRYWAAGLAIAAKLFSAPYLSTGDDHEGLLLHSTYHRPNGWDHVPAGSAVPRGESSMWGDYHARELALLVDRLARGLPYYTFFGCAA